MPRKMVGAPQKTTVVKISQRVRDFIEKNTIWKESVDQTLRRLLKIPLEDHPERKKSIVRVGAAR